MEVGMTFTVWEILMASKQSGYQQIRCHVIVTVNMDRCHVLVPVNMENFRRKGTVRRWWSHNRCTANVAVCLYC